MISHRKRLGELLNRLQETVDEEILIEIVEMTQYDVLEYARRLTWDRSFAEDLSQTAFITLAQRYREIETDVLAWLFGVVRNTWRQESKHISKQDRLITVIAAITDNPVQQPSILEKLANEEDRSRMSNQLDTALSKLSPRERECVWLRYAEGFEVPAIASCLELAVTSVYTYCSKGLHKLREQGVWKNVSEQMSE